MQVPQHSLYRAPLPEEKSESEVRHQHIGTALDWPRHYFRPDLLESRARHYAVLESKDDQKRCVYEQAGHEWNLVARIDRLRDDEVSKKSNQVEKNTEKS